MPDRLQIDCTCAMCSTRWSAVVELNPFESSEIVDIVCPGCGEVYPVWFNNPRPENQQN